ncbi:MAG: PEP-CTERM sorting domain-containing protein [Planctomycetaceae bacterium]|nr:PEP-CTERM sorting domain-containing protein [Planctomycetaceae bacterium]
MKRFIPKACFWLVAVGLLMPAADASLIIDDFENGTIALEATNAAPFAELSNQATTSAIGGYRDTAVWLLSPYLSVRANSNPIPGVIAFSSGSQSTGQFSLLYAGEDNLGLGGIDITEGGKNRQINVDFNSADLGADTGLILYNSPENLGEVSQILVGGPGIVSFKLSDFADQGIDLTTIDAIELVIFGDEDGDYTIDSIYATVPEPGTIAIWSLFGVGLAFYVRRQHKS